MPLFQRKPKVVAADFCRQWYDRAIFGSELDAVGLDARGAIVEALIEPLQDAGVDLMALDLDLLGEEIDALRLELFGTAYAHRTREKVSLGAAETAATKDYLSQRGRGDLWDRMAIYNETIAAITTTRGTKVLIRMIDDMRVSLFKDYIKAGAERECAVRALNRLGTDVDFLKIAPNRLGYVLAGQANLDPSDQVVLIFGALAMGFYNGARESLDEVDLQV